MRLSYVFPLETTQVRLCASHSHIFHSEDPSFQTHQPIYSFTQSHNTSKVVSEYLHPYLPQKQVIRKSSGSPVSYLSTCPCPGACRAWVRTVDKSFKSVLFPLHCGYDIHLKYTSFASVSFSFSFSLLSMLI